MYICHSLKYVSIFNIKCLAEYGFQKSYPEELAMQSNREVEGWQAGLVARRNILYTKVSHLIFHAQILLIIEWKGYIWWSLVLSYTMPGHEEIYLMRSIDQHINSSRITFISSTVTVRHSSPKKWVTHCLTWWIYQRKTHTLMLYSRPFIDYEVADWNYWRFGSWGGCRPLYGSWWGTAGAEATTGEYWGQLAIDAMM